MERTKEVSQVDDVVLPVELVTLESLRTKDGSPVVVQCESVDELRMVRVVKAWPGLLPPTVEAAGALDEQAQLDMADKLAPDLIPMGTMLLAADGTEIRPAFWFNVKPEGSRALPGHLLKQGDRVELMTAILRQSGYLKGGPADSGSFHGGERGGDGAGASAVGASAGSGQDTVGSPE